MTILQKPPQSGTTHTRKRWYTFGHANEAVPPHRGMGARKLC